MQKNGRRIADDYDSDIEAAAAVVVADTVAVDGETAVPTRKKK